VTVTFRPGRSELAPGLPGVVGMAQAAGPGRCHRPEPALLSPPEHV